mmetsp:Transcript_14134/g.21261  ORF Transcript_14134/g.21261 Transcript_14134/m.21261 type:complete len:142 (+) Transcript_14134:1-426(+)
MIFRSSSENTADWVRFLRQLKHTVEKNNSSCSSTDSIIPYIPHCIMSDAATCIRAAIVTVFPFLKSTNRIRLCAFHFVNGLIKLLRKVSDDQPAYKCLSKILNQTKGADVTRLTKSELTSISHQLTRLAKEDNEVDNWWKL